MIFFAIIFYLECNLIVAARTTKISEMGNLLESNSVLKQTIMKIGLIQRGKGQFPLTNFGLVISRSPHNGKRVE